jgi:FkbM family methyltransferase
MYPIVRKCALGFYKQSLRTWLALSRRLEYIGKVHNNLWTAARRAVEAQQRNQRPAVRPFYSIARFSTAKVPFYMILRRPGLFEDRVEERGIWETGLSRAIDFFMREGKVFVDVGANVGWHALRVAALVPGAKVVCFEPHPDIYRELCRNVAINGLLDDIMTHNTALGDCAGEVDFYLPSDAAYNRGLGSAQANYDLPGHKNIRVLMTRLDECLQPTVMENVTVIKIDVQGHERQVLRGMHKTITNSRPVIFFEFEASYHEHAAEVFQEILNQLSDYKVFVVRDTGASNNIHFSEFDLPQVTRPGFEADFVCLPRERYGF